MFFLSFDLLFFLFVQATASKYLTSGRFSHPEQGSSQHASAFRPSPAQHTLKTQLWKGETTHLVAQKTSHLPGSLFRRYRWSEEQAFGRRPEPQTAVCGPSTVLYRAGRGQPTATCLSLLPQHWQNWHRSTGHVFCVMSTCLRGQARYRNPPSNQMDMAGSSGLQGDDTTVCSQTEARRQPQAGRTFAEMQNETSGLASGTTL